mmetsp:Transcript_5805/g.21968  ORF Transcript_5805/g.21968 Transcript_5805/m.21968 type:complete len:203 (+) Transcript_5805:256-864(+)
MGDVPPGDGGRVAVGEHRESRDARGAGVVAFASASEPPAERAGVSPGSARGPRRTGRRRRRRRFVGGIIGGGGASRRERPAARARRRGMRRGRLAGELPEAHARVPGARRPRRLPARAAILRSRARVVRLRRRRVPVPRLCQTVPRVRQVPQARDGRGSDGVPRRADPRRSERVAHVRLRAHGARRRGMDPVGHVVRIRRVL